MSAAHEDLLGVTIRLVREHEHLAAASMGDLHPLSESSGRPYPRPVASLAA